jgi:mycothiol synthase
VVVPRLEENQHIGQFTIEVLPEYRRRGLARQLLVHIAGVARRENRRVLIAETTERILAGSAFMQRIGAEKGMEGHTNQLKLAELDRGLLVCWLARADELAPAFELGLWIGPYPEDQMQAVVALHEVMNQQPYDNLELHDIHYTPEQIRQMEQANFANGTQRWTLYARDRASGDLAGFTELYFNPRRPAVLQQGNTGVFPQYRSRGLGRWLKAAMLDKVLRERPDAQFVRTGNADSNAPMLKINNELGFKPYISQCFWQVETERVMGYLNQRRTPLPV